MNVSTLENYSATVPMQLVTCCRFDAALLRLKVKQHINVTISMHLSRLPLLISPKNGVKANIILSFVMCIESKT
jgi:hypothetical protein